MTTTKQRIATLVLAGMLTAAGAFAASATVAASDAHALQQSSYNTNTEG